MKLSRSDREGLAIGSVVFSFLALLFAFGAVMVAVQAESRSDTANAEVAKIQSSARSATPRT